MIKIYEKQRAAISSNGWLTLMSDLRNWRFDIYVGGDVTKDGLVDKFRVHMKDTVDFVVDICMRKHYDTDEEKNRYADSASKWLSRKLIDCNICNTSGHNANGVTISSKSGPIVIVVPGFDLSDPRSIATLAHEFIHAAIIFSEKLGIEEVGGFEFMTNIHTTLFERTLRIVADFREKQKVNESVPVEPQPWQDGMPMAINDYLCNQIAYMEVADDDRYRIYLARSKEYDDMYRLVIAKSDTKHYVIMCNFKHGGLFGMLDPLIERYSNRILGDAEFDFRLNDAIVSTFGGELIKAAVKKYEECFEHVDIEEIKQKFHIGDVYEFKTGTTVLNYKIAGDEVYIHFEVSRKLMISKFEDSFIWLISPTDDEFKLKLVDFNRFVKDGSATFCIPNKSPDDNGETGTSFFDVDDIFVFTKGVHLHISAETKNSELELADEKTMIITRIEGEWIFLNDTKSDLGFRITSKDMFNYYQNGKILYKRKAKDEPEPAASRSSCNEEKQIEDMLTTAKEFTSDKYKVGETFVCAKDFWGFRSWPTWKDKSFTSGTKLEIVSIKECYVIFQGILYGRFRKILGLRSDFDHYLRDEIIKKCQNENSEIRVGDVFICMEELKKEDLPGLEYNLGKGVTFDITVLSSDRKWCGLRAGSYDANGFSVERLEKFVKNGTIAKKTPSN